MQKNFQKHLTGRGGSKDVQKSLFLPKTTFKNRWTFINLLVRRPIHRLKMSQCLSNVREPTPTPGFKNRPLTALVTKIQLQILNIPPEKKSFKKHTG